MSFDYSQSGLPAHDTWALCMRMCHRWLQENMGHFGEERLTGFMMHQPVQAAKNLLHTCPDVSDAAIMLVLLGPAKGALLAGAEMDVLLRHSFGDAAVDLMHALEDPALVQDAARQREINRIFMAEGISTMTDQMIGRARIDAFHQKRREILQGLEARFAEIKGADPALDALFEDAARRSRQSLDALDDAAKKHPKPPEA